MREEMNAAERPVLLDGVWDLAFTETVEAAPEYAECAAVPGCFDAAGLRYPQQGCGWYRRRVRAEGDLRLEVGSFGMRLAAFWDGEKLGESSFAWSPAVFEFTAGPGEHELVLRADNIVSGHPLFRPNYDFYAFGGIFDHVKLARRAPDEIRYLAVLPLDHTTGLVEIRVETDAPTLTLAFDDGPAETVPAAAVLRRNVPDLRVWSPETPHLHRLTVNGKTVTFGIRTLDWSGPQLLLNGREIKLLGVNRHESHPEFGPATPESLIASDLLQLKRAGFNFVRGSHYPQREFLFDFCDRIGMLVWEEPLAWGNPAADLADPVFSGSLLAQNELTVRRSINHPSLVIHGFLNECASDTEEGKALISRLVEQCHKLDPTRPATFACNHVDTDISLELCDIAAVNVYPAWYGPQTVAEIPDFLLGLARKHAGKPVIVSEIGAAAILGDHSGNRWSEEYQAEVCTRALRCVAERPEFTGIALWLYCNANTYITGRDALMRPRGFNNKGLLDEYRRPKAAWHALSRLIAELKEKHHA